MGTSLCCNLGDKIPEKVLMLGLDGAGKTCIFYELAYNVYLPGMGESPLSTHGFNVSTVQYGDYTMWMWEVSGQCSIREQWHRFYPYTKAVIFVVDAYDKERMGGICGEEIASLVAHGFIRSSYSADSSAEFPSDLMHLIGEYCTDAEDEQTAKHELHRVLQAEELRDAILLIYANKQDLPNAMSYEEVVHRLDLRKLKKRPWHIELSVASTGEGLYEGLDWIRNTLCSK